MRVYVAGLISRTTVLGFLNRFSVLNRLCLHTEILSLRVNHVSIYHTSESYFSLVCYWLVRSLLAKYYSPPSSRWKRKWLLSTCAIYTKTFIHLSVSESGGYLPCRFVPRYISTSIHLHFGEQLLIIFSLSNSLRSNLSLLTVMNGGTWNPKLALRVNSLCYNSKIKGFHLGVKRMRFQNLSGKTQPFFYHSTNLIFKDKPELCDFGAIKFNSFIWIFRNRVD